MKRKYLNRYRVDTIRLQKWNYSWNAAYFITINIQNRKRYFGSVANRKMIHSKIGEIAWQFWEEIPEHFPFVKLDAFIIMPDHMHGMVIIDHPEGKAPAIDQPAVINPDEEIDLRMAEISPGKGSLASVIRSYKSAVTRSARIIEPKFEWQPRYYERIIRDARAFGAIRRYIRNNPKNWRG